MKRLFVAALVVSTLCLPALAQKKYDVGASDKEIKIGNTNPYSGPASAYGAIGKSIAAYFRMLNERGGINGRRGDGRRRGIDRQSVFSRRITHRCSTNSRVNIRQASAAG